MAVIVGASSASSQPPWLCHHYRIHGGAHIVVVAITIVSAVREALPATNTAPFPAEGAAGLASNSQAWLREPRLQSPRHCSPGQGQRQSTDPDARGERARRRARASMPGYHEGTPTEGMRRHHGRGERTRTDGAVCRHYSPQREGPKEVEGAPKQASRETRCRCRDPGRGRRVVVSSQLQSVVVVVMAVVA